MKNASSLVKIIGEIYEASSVPAHWDYVLELMATELQADASSILFHDYNTPKANVRALYSRVYPKDVFREIADQYQSYYYKLNPLWKIAQEKTDLGVAFSDSQLGMSREAFEQSCPKEFLDYMRRYDHWYLGGAFLFRDSCKALAVTVMRGAKGKPWSQAEMDFVTELTPHFQRAFMFHRNLSSLSTQASNLSVSFDRLHLGFILLDPDGAVSFKNKMAKNLLATHPIITEFGGAVQSARPTQNGEFQHAIQKTRLAAPNALESNIHIVSLKSLNSEKIIPVIVMPISNRDANKDSDSDQNSVAIFFTDPLQAHALSRQLLSEMYGLTDAEINVAVAISQGLTPQEVAEELRVKVVTIRSQLSSIYSKMGINRQTELVKLMLQLPKVDTGEVPETRKAS